MDAPRILLELEAARWLRISQRTLENWRLARTGPAYLKIGRQVRYRREDLEEFLRAARRAPAEKAQVGEAGRGDFARG